MLVAGLGPNGVYEGLLGVAQSVVEYPSDFALHQLREAGSDAPGDDHVYRRCDLLELFDDALDFDIESLPEQVVVLGDGLLYSRADQTLGGPMSNSSAESCSGASLGATCARSELSWMTVSRSELSLMTADRALP